MEIKNLIFFFVLLGLATALKSPKITNITEAQSKKVGENVTLSCSISKVPSDWSLLWVKNGSAISMDGGQIVGNTRLSVKIQKVSSTTTYVLRIVNLTFEDNGTYSCTIQTSTATNATERTVDLSIHEAPSIYYSSPNTSVIAVEENATVVLDCDANGHPTPNVTWQRVDNRTLPTGEIKYRGNVLNISSIRKEHRGIYSCIAENGISPNSRRDFRIFVEMKPIITVEQPRLEQALNLTAVLQCHVESYPAANVTWHKNSFELSSGEHFNISQTTDASGNQNATLRIIDVELRHYGNYTCKAKNKFGDSQKDIELIQTKGGTGTIPKCSKLLISFVLLNRIRYMLPH